MKQNYDAEFFEKHSKNALSKKELSAYHEQLKSDIELQEDSKAYSKILNGFQQLQMSNLQSEVEKWEDEYSKSIDSETELIEAYLSGSLADPDNAYVKKMIASDKHFAEAVGAQQQLQQGFQKLQVDEMISEVNIWENEVSNQSSHDQKSIDASQKPLAKQRTLNSNRKRWRIAAVLIPFILVSAQILLNQQFGNQALLNQAYALPLSTQLRSTTGSEAEESLDAVLNAMKKNEIQQAESILSNLFIQNPDDVQLKMMQVHLNIQKKDYKAANNILQTMEPTIPEQLDEKAWLDALVAIGLKRPSHEVRTLLDRITKNARNPHEREAQELLLKYNSFWRKITI